MIAVIRPAWRAENDDQRRALDRAIKLAQQHEKAEAAMWEAIRAARERGVPDTVICERTGQSRATLNRRYGTRPTTEPTAD